MLLEKAAIEDDIR